MPNFSVHIYEMEMCIEKKETKKVGEINHEPNIHEHLIFNERTFVVCYIDVDNKRCGVHEIFEFNGEHEDTKNMICPHCGYEDYDSFEFHDDEDTRNCSHCGKPFNYYRETTITYTTEKL